MNPTPRELDTILAALRWWQGRHTINVTNRLPTLEACNAIASEHGAPLDAAEIDRLCERLNAPDAWAAKSPRERLADLVGAAEAARIRGER